LDDAKWGYLYRLDRAEKLTRYPRSVSEGDIDALRELGWSDRAIHDATQMIAYFYINRIADGLGVDLEPEMPPLEE
jgi:alkylhydroperoxidase family enzyme